MNKGICQTWQKKYLGSCLHAGTFFNYLCICTYDPCWHENFPSARFLFLKKQKLIFVEHALWFFSSRPVKYSHAFSFDILSLLSTHVRHYFTIVFCFWSWKLKLCLKMYKSIEPIINFVKVKHFTTSDIYFTLNTKFTPILLLCFSLLLTTMDVLRTFPDFPSWSFDIRLVSLHQNICSCEPALIRSSFLS